jgi:hypothetical protein
VHRGLDPGFPVVSSRACVASFQAPEWKRVSPFLAPFSSRCSHCIVLFLRMLPLPRTAGHGAETREHRRQQTDSVAVARALRPQFPFNDARCTYVAVPTATSSLLVVLRCSRAFDPFRVSFIDRWSKKRYSSSYPIFYRTPACWQYGTMISFKC